jgi:hypothetical protein
MEEALDVLPLWQFSDSIYDGIQMIDQKYVVSPPPLLPVVALSLSAAAATTDSSKSM